MERESKILGLILRDPTCLDRISSLKSEHFTNDELGKIYSVFVDLYEKGTMPSIYAFNAILPRLRQIGVDIPDDGLMRLKDLASAKDGIEILASEVIEAKEALKLHNISNWLSNQLLDGVYSDKIRSLLAEKLIETDDSGTDDIATMQECVSEAAKDAEHRAVMFRQGKPIGITTGLTDYDNFLRGWQAGSLNILAGRSGQGKTSLSLHLAVAAARAGYPGVFFSLEMSKTELLGKIISSQIEGLSYDNFLRGNINESHFKRMVEVEAELGKLPITISDKTTTSIRSIESIARRLKRQGKCEWIVVDYIQYIKASGEKGKPREQVVAEISKSLKLLAKDLQVPIIALAQLNRNVEQRSDRAPQMSDLRESGAIEQDADTITFIYRPKTYKIDNVETQKYGNIDTTGIAVLIVAKNRHGACGGVYARHNPELSLFSDYEPQHIQHYDTERYNDATPF